MPQLALANDLAPTSANPTNFYQTLFTANWGANGNPGGTEYGLLFSDTADFSHIIWNASTTNTNWTVTGLTPGVTYYTDVQAGWLTPQVSSFTVLPSTVTPTTGLPGPPPANPVISSETYSSIAVTWSPPSLTGAAYGYSVQASTASDFTGSIFSPSGSTVTLNAVLSGNGIASSTTYYVRVGAYWGYGLYTYANTVPASIVTDSSNAITGLIAYQVGSSSITWSWNPVAGATSYNVYMATSPSTRIASVTTSSFTDTGLAINTLYGRQVTSVVGGIEGALCNATSSYTLAATPGGPTYSNVFYSSAILNWASNGNSASTVYNLERSVDPAFGSWTNYAASTYTSFSFNDLAIGTSYYFRVTVNNSANVTTVGPITSTTTLAAVPGQPTFTNVNYTSATVSWSSQSNPAGTPYEVSQSTFSDFSSGVSTPIAFSANFTGTTTTFFNLTSATTYYFRVRAQNANSVATSFSPIGLMETNIMPGPTLLSGAVQGVSSITWTWSNVAGATFNLYDASNSSLIAGGIASSSYTEVNLSTNTSYGRKVTAVLHGESAFSNSMSTYTLAAIPASANPTNVQYSQLTANWLANGNPAGTSYLIQVSTDPGFVTIAISSFSDYYPYAFLNGLTSSTTYYMRVQAVNGDGAATAFIALPSTTTTSGPTPVNPAISNETYNSITVTWSSPTPDVAYWTIVQASTAANFTGSIVSVSSPTDTLSASLSSSGIASSTTYYVRVGLLYNGVYTYANTSPASIVTDRNPYLPPNPENPTNIWPTLYTLNWAPTSTLFYLQVATDPGYSNTVINLITGYSNWTLTDLSPGTTYYSRVLANPNESDQTPFVTLSTTTMPASGPPGPAPINPIIYSESYSSISVTWSWPLLPPATTHGFSVQASTASDFSGTLASGTLIYPSSGPATVGVSSAVISGLGLASSTTYYVRVGAVYPTGNSNTTTVNYALTTPASIVTDSSNAITGLSAFQVWRTSITWSWNPVAGASSYNVYLATSPGTRIASVTVSSFTDSGLAINALYGRQVSAVVGGIEGPLCGATSSYTLTQPPGVPTFTNVAYTSATISWDANGNPPGTPYEYTEDFSYGDTGYVFNYNGNFTSTTTFFSGLAEGCSFYFSVVSRNSAGVRSESPIGTLATPGSFLPRNFTGTVTGSTSITWTWGAPQGADDYELYPASAPTIGNEGTSGLIDPITGLIPNTAYGVVIRAFHQGAAGPLTPATTVYTWANVPGTPIFSQVGYTSATVTWSSQSNPAGTPYEVSQSTVSDFGDAVSTPIAFTANFTGTTTTFFNLSNGITYYIRVRAENGDNITTSFSSIGSTTTLTMPVPTLVSGTVQGVSSITWTWSNVAGATFNLYNSSNSSLIAGGIGSTSYTEINLSTNTSYRRMVTAVLYGESAFSNSISTFTLASTPTAANPTNVQISQLTANWLANGNPYGTTYLAQASVDPAFGSIAASSSTVGTAAILAGLASSTTYYIQVQALNGDSIATGFVTLPSTTTLPAPPAAPTLSATASGPTSIQWSWNLVTGAAGYRVYSSTGGNLSGDLGSSTTFFIQTNLSTNTTYTDSLVAFNVSGVSTSTALSRFTLALPPAGSVITDVGVSSISVSWSSDGNPAGTTYQSSLWEAGGATTTLSGTGASQVFSSLSAETTYFLTVRALNGENVATAYDVTLSTFTLAISEAVVTVDPDSGQTVVLQGHDGPITLQIPAQAFSGDATVTLEEPESYPTNADNEEQFQTTGVGVQILIDQSIEPTKPVTITIPFHDSEVAGFDKNKLILARYDTAHNNWVPYVSRIDTIHDTVTADVNHFSLYQIMASVVPDALAPAQIFPNPFRPALGHTSVTISNLPAGTRIRIYTLAGELVKDLSANAAGMASWDGTNQSGQKVASGLYFVLVQGAGSQTRLRVVVQR